jgi:hypothetical protein
MLERAAMSRACLRRGRRGQSLDCPRPPTPLVAFEPYAGQRWGCSENASDAGAGPKLNRAPRGN